MKNRKIILIYLLGMIFISACNGGGDTPNSNPDTVSATITVDQLPGAVAYNKTATPDGHVEYSWGVTFDINGDGAINQGDIQLSLKNFKSPGSTETTGPISDFQANLWLYNSGTSVTSVAVAKKEISGNSITLSINKNAHASLSSINDSTLVYFSTTKRNDISGLSEHDYYPSFSTLVNIPANKRFTDTQGDVNPKEVDMVSMGLTF